MFGTSKHRVTVEFTVYSDDEYLNAIDRLTSVGEIVDIETEVLDG